MENKSKVTIEQILDDTSHFSFREVEQAIINRNCNPLTESESEQLLYNMENYFKYFIESSENSRIKKLRLNQLLIIAEDLNNPENWNLNSLSKTKAYNSIRNFFQVSASILTQLVAKKSQVTKRNMLPIPEPKTNRLNQQQTSIFIQLLQHDDFIHSEIFDVDLAEYITALTGYLPDDMKNSFTIKLDQKIKSQPVHVSKVIQYLNHLSSKLSKMRDQTQP